MAVAKSKGCDGAVAVVKKIFIVGISEENNDEAV